MPRPVIDLEPHKVEIIHLFQNNNSPSSITADIRRRYDISVQCRTIKSRLQEWGIQKQPKGSTTNSALHTRVRTLFFENGLEDKDILLILRREGFSLTVRTPRRLQSQLGLCRRENTLHPQENTEQIKALIKTELENGLIREYGKELLHRHFRRKGMMITR
jgi:hypothetical protein